MSNSWEARAPPSWSVPETTNEQDPHEHANIFLEPARVWRWVPALPTIRIIMSGKVRNRFVAEGIEEYVRRSSAFARIEIVGIKPRGKKNRGAGPRKISEGELTIALDPGGNQMTSGELADLLKGKDRIAFLVGGPEGHTREALESSQVRMSLSRMTLTSELAELVLAEQIYRALTILNSHPYHK